MAEDLKNVPENEEFDHIALEDEEGNVVDFVVDGWFDYNDNTYFALVPFEQVEQDEVDLVIMRVEGEDLVAIDDDKELMEAFQEYDQIVNSEE